MARIVRSIGLTLLAIVFVSLVIREARVYGEELTAARQHTSEQTHLFVLHQCAECLAAERARPRRGTCAAHLRCHALEPWTTRSAYLEAAENTVLALNPCSGSDVCRHITVFAVIVALFTLGYGLWLWFWWLVSPATSPLARAMALDARAARKNRELACTGASDTRRPRPRRLVDNEPVPDLFADGYVGR
jgi:hypothetical protein